MSDRDLLARATDALRESTVPSADDGALTLARLQKTMRSGASPSSIRRRLTRFVLLPIAAVFVVTGAWAGATGRMPRWLALRSAAETEHDTREHAAPPPAPPPAPVAPPAVAMPAEPAPSIEPPLPTTPPAPPPVRSARTPALVDVDALYREAHDAHFARRDYAAAVGAWDRYLAAAGPGGRFVVEARYNRAIALVRAGRRAEAAAALRPFADGDYGGYRRDEARELLRTIE